MNRDQSSFDLIESAAWEAFEEGFHCGQNPTGVPVRERFARWWWDGEERVRMPLAVVDDEWSALGQLLAEAQEVTFTYGDGREPAVWRVPDDA